MNKPKEVRKIGEFDVTNLLGLLTDDEIDFSKEISKKYKITEHFYGCGSFFLIDHFKILEKDSLIKIQNSLTDMLKIFDETYGPGEIWRLQIAKLDSDGEIVPHYDVSLASSYSHRIHIPLITNRDVKFTIGENEYYFDVGEIVEINNSAKHSVKNSGQEARIHLILDYIGYEYSKFIKKPTIVYY
jgi:hypothetical protein